MTVLLVRPELDDLVCWRSRGGELAVVEHQEGCFHRFCDERRTLLFELGGHGLAFRIEAGFEASAFGGHVGLEAALLVLQRCLCGEVAGALGLVLALRYGEAAA